MFNPVTSLDVIVMVLLYGAEFVALHVNFILFLSNKILIQPSINQSINQSTKQ